MRSRRAFLGVCLIAGSAFLPASARGASNPFSVLHSFDGQGGVAPQSPLVVDSAGNLFGTVPFGGSGSGAVFELVRNNLAYTFRLVYSFTGKADGGRPFGGLVADSSGNLFGAAAVGGDSGNGTIYELVAGGSTFTFERLYSFSGAADGLGPLAGLAIDGNGDLYGAASRGGPSGTGTVFALRHGDQGYTFQLLYSFSALASGVNNDGAFPEGTPLVDASGDIFGTAAAGGVSGFGTVFELVRTGSSYSFVLFHAFLGGADSSLPAAGLVADAEGNLFGTTAGNPNAAEGTVFELQREPASSAFEFRTLYAFLDGNDGAVPTAPLIVDGLGNLFGTATQGGPNDSGTIFELARAETGFDFRVLYAFQGDFLDGDQPAGGVTFGPAGKLYGTTLAGGVFGFGTVFALAPPPTALDQVVLVSPGAPVTITLSASDPNIPQSSFHFAIVTQPAHGALSSIHGNTVTYTPGASFSGSDSFTYTAANDDGTSNPATVSITDGVPAPRRVVPVSPPSPVGEVGPRHP
jgi:uncharacterized repeat protein (TIGR03803 family)